MNKELLEANKPDKSTSAAINKDYLEFKKILEKY